MKLDSYMLGVALVALSGTATGADPDYAGLVARVEKAVAHDLKDPDSAKFRDMRVTRTVDPETHRPYSSGEINPRTNQPYGVNVCGELNAKNSYGGYTGFKPFVAFEGSDGISIVQQGDSLGLFSILMRNGQCDNVIKKF